MQRLNLPELDLFLSMRDVGENKGSPKWFAVACERLDLAPQEFLYVGDDDLDWRTALQGGVIYLHASWAKLKPARQTSIHVVAPKQVLIFASQFLMVPPRWQYKLDVPDQGLTVRSLMYAYTRLPATSQGLFKPHDVFHPSDPDAPEIKNVDAFVGEMLVLHALTSLHLEGLLERGAFYTVYPSSKPDSVNEVLAKFIDVSAKLFSGYWRGDLLQRIYPAPDTSDERYKAKQANTTFPINFKIQSDTLCVNEKYRKSKNLEDRTVVVFDDFTTTGTSLEWARNLLYEAGAKFVVVVTIAKYGSRHRVHILNDWAQLQPFEVVNYAPNTFRTVDYDMALNPAAPIELNKLFQAWKNQSPYLPSAPVLPNRNI